MNDAIRAVRGGMDRADDAQPIAVARQAVAAAVATLAETTVHARTDVTDRQNAADAKRRSTLEAVGALSVILIAAATLVAVRQYRAVMLPLDRLTKTVRGFASGQLSDRSEPVGDREFVALASDFNRMAGELESFYRELQTKVAVQSRELARSQRLASVGFLAAGVSHEINNPLGIITGYAERLLRLLDEPIDPDNQLVLWQQTRRTMSIICEEAFRCKTITTRLLSLAHPANHSGNRSEVETMGRVSLVAVARQVISNLAGLPEYANKQMILETPDGPSECFVRAREVEMQQVVLNLMLNALQAVGRFDGIVRLCVRAIDDAPASTIELAVSDNGVGMTDETLERIFEPFYSESRIRGAGGSGSGLGLSITHAIVIEHHGRIVAESGGLGKGSRFVVSFPAFAERERAAAVSDEGDR
jgi:signal transduction histidine kinase